MASDRARSACHSHSIVDGGFELMSYTTRLMPLHLVDDPRRDARQQLVRQARPVGGHAVAALDRADRHRVLVGALVAHHADALHRQQHRETLPEPRVPALAPHLFGDDRVRAAQQLEPRAASPRRGCAPRGPGPGTAGARRTPRRARACGRPSRTSSLKSSRSGSTSCHPHPLGQPADVVVALDERRLARRSTPTRSRRDRACPARGSPTWPSFAASASNTSMNVAPMIFRFCSGSVTPASRSRNSVDASTNTSGSCSRSKRRRICVGLVQPQHAVVDEDARQPVADRAVDEQRGDRRVDAAAERAHHAPAARPARGSSPSPPPRTTPSSSRPCSRRRRRRSCAGSRGRARCARPPGGTAARRAARADVGHRGDRRVRARRDDGEPGRRRGDEVAVARPHAKLVRHAGKQRARSRRLARRRTVTVACPNSRCGAGATAPAERVRHQLHPVADAEHRRAELEHAPDRTSARPARRRSWARPTG